MAKGHNATKEQVSLRIMRERDELREKVKTIQTLVRALADDAMPHAVSGHSSVQTKLIDDLVREALE